MKKILFLSLILSAACFASMGCSSNKTPISGGKSVQTTSQPFTERSVGSTDGTYVFDKAGILSSEALKACNDYAGWLFSKKLINVAVIITNDLNGKAPYDYAVDEFGEIYEGKGSGLVILINNATNEDIVYRTGSCLTNISQTTENNALYWETKEIIGGDYRRGIMRLLQLGELCPEHFIDNAQIFGYEDIRRFENALSGVKEDITILATRNGSKTPNENILKDYYKRKYKEGNGIMLMLDTESRSIIAYSAEPLPAKIEKVMKDVNGLSSKDDYTGAIDKFIEEITK